MDFKESCYNCFKNNFTKLIANENLSTLASNDLLSLMEERYSNNNEDFSSPLFARNMNAILKTITNKTDLFREVKELSNDKVLAMYPYFKERVIKSENSFDTALRLAVAGNIIDYAIDAEFDLHSTIARVLHSDFAINHSVELKQEIINANKVLYLGDNCGEIVFDKLFIESIMHPHLTFAVRESPIYNDATIEDAKYVGMDVVADLISNGFDAPSTILDRCSPSFVKLFNEADVIISKGQGNLEGLINKTDKNIYFLLMVKCDVVAQELNVKKGDFVVVSNKELLKLN